MFLIKEPPTNGVCGCKGHTALRTATARGKSPLFPENTAAVWFPHLEAVNSRSSDPHQAQPFPALLWGELLGSSLQILQRAT